MLQRIRERLARLLVRCQVVPATGQSVSSAEAPTRRGRVLVVDDDALHREVARILIEDAGLQVDDARDGEEGLRLAREGGYALVLMDVQMPGMDGLEATRRLRRIPACRDLAILGMTANTRSDDRQRCLDAGMNDLLAKPFQQQSLVAALRLWCKGGIAPEQMQFDALRDKSV